jgi:3-methylcrotonyl-CoA carboxylase alpha subunit
MEDSMKTKKVQIDGSRADLSYALVGNTVWMHINGETHSFPFEQPKARRGHKGQEVDTGDIVAPMPGKVTQVLIKVGEKVAKGQTVVVMEAMKMEYNLKAVANLSVVTVNTKVGEQVQLGHILVHCQLEVEKK